jgi:hypothetical protein
VWLAPAIGGPAKLRGSTGTIAIIERRYSSAVSESACGRNSSGSLAIFTAILRASSRVSKDRLGRILFIESWFQLLFCYEYREILAGL